MEKAYNAGYRPSEKVLGWISVKDMLPEENGWYLTCAEFHGMPLGIMETFFNGEKFTDACDEVQNTDYWMPIPKLPEK